MEKGKINKVTVIYILLVILIFSVFINYKLFVLNKYYKGKIPYLLEGERFENVDIIDKDGQFIDPIRIKKGVSVIFIFLKNCSVCDKNIIFWKKMTKLLSDKVSVMGIVLDTPTKAFSFEESAKLNFKIYVPDNLPKFMADIRMMVSQSQTIVLRDGKVEMLRLGNLDGKSAVEIINFTKGLMK